MFQRFASVFFGDEMEEVSGGGQGEQRFDRQDEEEEEDEWILVDYLAEACSAPHGDGRSGLAVAPEPEDEEEDLVMVPSPVPSPRLRYASCTSLNSASDTDGGPEEEEEDEEGEEGFLQLEACSLEESWFVTPPPCFTGRGSKPLPLETSPLENLLIEHPSMSVYASSSSSSSHPRSPLTRDRAPPPAAATGKETGRRSLDAPRHRPDVAVVQRHAGLHSACYVAALSARAGLLDQAQQAGRQAQRDPPPSRKALHRLNLLRHPGGAKQAKTTAMYLHQPGHRHLNY